MSSSSVVIVGAGHAGVQAAASLREDGFQEPIVLLSDEPDLPYQRPPLSKAFLKGEMDMHGLPLRAEAFFRDQRDRSQARRARGANRPRFAARRDKRRERAGIRPSDPGDRSAATASRGAGRRPARSLQPAHDRRRDGDPRTSSRPGTKLVIVGAGFIGLEIAATALGLGAKPTVVEIARPMGRAVSPILSDFYLKAHAAAGVQFRIGRGVTEIRGAEKAEAVVLTDGEVLPADFVVVGVGVTAEDTLARESGLECANGVVVDAHLRTSDLAISAIGDCADFPNAALGFRTRLELVQNAVDQAKCVAARLTGKPAPYDALAWFWSDQGDLKLMIAGLSHGVDTWVLRGEPEARAFSAFGFRDGRLAVVELVNRAGDHAAAKRIIGTTKTLTPEDAANPAFDLRALAKR